MASLIEALGEQVSHAARRICGALVLAGLLGPPVALAEPTLALDAPATGALAGRRIQAFFSGLFGAGERWRARPRVGLVFRGTSADVEVDVAYLRAGEVIDRAHARGADAIELPARRVRRLGDAVSVRARAPGFVTWTLQLDPDRAPEVLVVELRSVRNEIVGVVLTHIASRTRLTFETQRLASVAVTDGANGGIALTLTGTRDPSDRVARHRGGWIVALEPVQLYEDLLVHISTPLRGTPRLRSSHDPITNRHAVALEFGEAEGPPPSAAAIAAEVAAIRFRPTACTDAFERALRAGSDREARRIAHRSGGRIADLYRRALLAHLEVLDLPDGRRLDGRDPVQLEMALQQAPEVRGFAALAARYAESDRDPGAVVRTLVAPKTSAEVFQPAWEAAHKAAARCAEG